MGKRLHVGPVRKAGNVVIELAIKSGLTPKRNQILITRGRRSGLERTNPVRLVLDGESRWLVAPYGPVDWVHNARHAGRVRLRRGRTVEEWTIQEVSGNEAGPVLKSYVKQNPIALPYFEAGLRSSIEEFSAEASKHPVFKLIGSGKH